MKKVQVECLFLGIVSMLVNIGAILLKTPPWVVITSAIVAIGSSVVIIFLDEKDQKERLSREDNERRKKIITRIQAVNNFRNVLAPTMRSRNHKIGENRFKSSISSGDASGLHVDYWTKQDGDRTVLDFRIMPEVEYLELWLSGAHKPHKVLLDSPNEVSRLLDIAKKAIENYPV